MKEKNLTIQNTKSLTTKKNEAKDLTKKNKNTALVKSASKKEVIDKELKVSKTSKKSNSNKKEAKLTKSEVEKKSNSKAKRNSSKEKNVNVKKTKTVTKKATSKSNSKRTDINSYAIEYFDLPYRYNETIVKLLVQTPKRLFVYWDIADADKENFINLFGNDFFNKTIPFLRIINESMNYSFDIEINDFANSWYININDENCKYHVELYRKFKENDINNDIKNLIQNLNKHNNNFNNNHYIFISSSNKMDAPNNKVLSYKYTYPRNIEYRNIKTNISSFKVVEKPNAEFYKTFFKDDDINIENRINFPSSR